jgi:hypothetical protein
MTIINRRTFVAERGKFQAAIDLLRGATQSARYKYRIDSAYYGAFDAIALEVEFESVAQMEEAWAEVNAQLEMAEFLNKWYAATQPGGSNEVWILEAQG